MIRAAIQIICFVLLVLGLAWVYNTLYGGPFGPFFNWLDRFLPADI